MPTGDQQAVLGRISGGENLSQEEMAEVVNGLMRGEWEDEAIALFLNALRLKGETTEEIAGAARAMRENMTPIRVDRPGVVDTCGTGGDGSGTFNISTAAALVAASAGVPVAKHGNRSITSKTGSADVLTALGVNVEADVATVERCMDQVGICFCFAPMLHPSMKHVAAARKSLGVPTIFNMLGPLCNPASAPFQLLGVGKKELRPKLSAALALLGGERCLVVCGEDGLDEVTLQGKTLVTEVVQGKIKESSWAPDDFNVPESGLQSLQVANPEESAAVIRSVLSGRRGPARDIVVLNAAAALWTAGAEETTYDCAARASDAIDEGRATALLEQLVEVSRS